MKKISQICLSLVLLLFQGSMYASAPQGDASVGGGLIHTPDRDFVGMRARAASAWNSAKALGKGAKDLVASSPKKFTDAVSKGAKLVAAFSPFAHTISDRERQWLDCELTEVSLRNFIEGLKADPEFDYASELSSLVDVEDKDGTTVLHKLFLDKGVAVDMATVTYLVKELGADINKPQARWGNTIFHMLAEKGFQKKDLVVLDALVALGAKPCKNNGDNESILHVLARQNGQVIDKEIVAWCHRQGVELCKQDENGDSFLHIVSRRIDLAGDTSAFEETFALAGDDSFGDYFSPSMQNGKGNTILHILARKGLKPEHPLYKVFTDHRVDTTVKNNEGKAVADIIAYPDLPLEDEESDELPSAPPSPRIDTPRDEKADASKQAPKNQPQSQHAVHAEPAKKQSFFTVRNAVIVLAVTGGISLFQYWYKNSARQRPAAKGAEQKATTA